MKTQAQIIERIRTTKNADVHGTSTLYLFLERAGQIEIMGRFGNEAARFGAGERSFRQPLTIADIGPMLVDLITQAREWEPTAGSEHNERVQRIRKANIRALLWLLDDDLIVDWDRPMIEILPHLELRYGVTACSHCINEDETAAETSERWGDE